MCIRDRFYDALAATIADPPASPADPAWVVHDDLLGRGAALKRLVAELSSHRLGGLAVPFSPPLVPLLRDLDRHRVPILQIGGPPVEAPRLHLEFDRAAVAARMAGPVSYTHLDVYKRQHRRGTGARDHQA